MAGGFARLDFSFSDPGGAMGLCAFPAASGRTWAGLAGDSRVVGVVAVLAVLGGFGFVIELARVGDGCWHIAPILRWEEAGR